VVINLITPYKPNPHRPQSATRAVRPATSLSRPATLSG